MKRFLVDTDVLVDYLRGNEKSIRFVKNHADRIVLSAISVAELYSGVKGDEEREALDAFIDLFPSLEVTPEAAKLAGEFRRDFLKSHRLGLADALIAATAECHEAELKTLNTKQFPMLRGLRVPYRK
jgi:predicted nucleic acid-binding protein